MLNLLKVGVAHLAQYLERASLSNRWFGIARSLLAFTQLVTLLATNTTAFFVPVYGMDTAPHCESIKRASVYCLGPGPATSTWRFLVVIVILVAVLVGYFPQFTVFLHAWVAYSFAVTISLPDGGDTVAVLLTILMIPIGLADNRINHWRAPTMGASRLAPMAIAAWWVLRLQIALIYLDSALSKFAVSDWSNGTAEYYFVRNNMFGTAAPLKSLALFVTRNSFLTLSLTWGALLIEIAIGVLLLKSHRWRIAGLVLDIMLHAGIIATIGLWSFSLTMISAAILAAAPVHSELRIFQRVLKRDTDPLSTEVIECKSDKRAERGLVDVRHS